MIINAIGGFLFFTLMVAALAISVFLWGLAIFAIWNLL